MILETLGWVACAVLLLTLCGILTHWVNEFSYAPIRWPRAWAGWKRLFWIFLGRCPVDHGALLTDPWSGGDTLFCFKCDGVSMWPANIVIALQHNYRMHSRNLADRRGAT